MKKNIFALLGLSIALTGCSSLSYDEIYGSQPGVPQTTTPSNQSTPEESQQQTQDEDYAPQEEVVEQKADTAQLQNAASQLTETMLSSAEVSQIAASGAPVLYVGTVNNASANYLDTTSLTTAIANQIYVSGKFAGISQSKVDEVRSQLSLTSDEELPDLNSAVQYGKMLGAQYMLFSQVSGGSPTYQVAMRMMDLNSGLIVWKGNQ